MTTATLPPPAKTKLMTIEEFGETRAGDYVELIDGRVVEIPMADLNHGVICQKAGMYLGMHILSHPLGVVASNDSFVKTRSTPPRVRGADVCFLSYKRWPKGQSLKGVLPVVPELILEVRSPSGRDGEVSEKTAEYLRAGVDVVVVIDPDSQTATLHRKGKPEQFVAADGSVTVPDLLPGFALPLSKLFE